jgi:transposase
MWNVKPADICRQVSEAYGKNALSEGMVRKWVRKLKEGRDNVHEEPRSGRQSVLTGDHVLRKGGTETGAPLWKMPYNGGNYLEK